MQEIRTLRSTSRGLERGTAGNFGLPARQSSTLLMSGDGERGLHARPELYRAGGAPGLRNPGGTEVPPVVPEPSSRLSAPRDPPSSGCSGRAPPVSFGISTSRTGGG